MNKEFIDANRRLFFGCFRSRKGSLTVEAAIVFPLFLCMMIIFMLLLRTVTLTNTLDNAVNDTVKQLAANCYVMSFLNELEDEKAADMGLGYDEILKAELATFKGNTIDMGANTLVELLSGSFGKSSLDQLSGSFRDEFDSRVQSTLGRVLIKQFGDKYLILKRQIKQIGVYKLLESNIDGSAVDIKNLSLIYCELPQSEIEYYDKIDDPEYDALYKQLGFKPEIDDTVLVVKYDNSMQLPFFGKVKFTTIHKGVEKGWLTGSRGVSGNYYEFGQSTGGNSIDGIGEDDLKPGSLVYVTKTGTKYHSAECLYLEKSRIPLKLEEALVRKYLPCKVCITKTAKPIKTHR